MTWGHRGRPRAHEPGPVLRLWAQVVDIPDERVVRVVGEIDYETAPMLRDALRSALAQPGHPARLAVDLSSVWATSPLAVRAAFAGPLRSARSRGIAMTVVNAPAEVRRSLENA
jgi:anti-anti-sigma factor